MAAGWSLACFFLLTFAVAGFAAQFEPGLWYASIQKPGFTPPNWVFAPAWTVLYAAMAVAGWMVWRVAGWGRALALWIAQLLLNGAWSWLFFGLHEPGLALAEILVLWIAIAATIAVFLHVRRAAAFLLVPYLAWVSFAGLLNAAIWHLNR